MPDINYINYSEDLFKLVVKDKSPRVYVFNNYNNKQRGEEIYERPVLKKGSLFLTMSELKEKIFPADSIVLKEEKLSIIFYELLSKKEKEQLGVDNYFDVIDLANDFYHFYNELNEYNVNKIKGLKDWQQDKLKIYQALRQRYIDYMQGSGYSDKTLNYRMDNIDLQYLDGYKEVVFVNIIEFTVLEKQLLRKIENSKTVSLYLQLLPRDFDEKELRLKSVSLPEELKAEVKLYHSSEKLLQLVNMLNKLQGSRDCILDADFANSNYHQLLSSAEIEVNKDFSFTQTSVFRFLQSLYDLMVNADREGKELKLRMKDLITACYRPEFRNYYQIEDSNFAKLHRLAEEDYVYFSRSLIDIDSDLKKFELILNEVADISNFKTMQDFCHFLDDIDFKYLNDRHYSNNYTAFLDALAELKSLANMGLVAFWSTYFTNSAKGLFRLIINYLRYKKVKKIGDGNKDQNIIEDLKNAACIKRNRLIIINADSDVIPSSPVNDFLLNEKQRQKMGLPVKRDRRISEKYYFLRHVLNSKEVLIFSLENIEDNKTASPFVEELKLCYGLENRPVEIEIDNYPQVIDSIFTYENSINNYLSKEIQKKDCLKMENCDFPDQNFSISYYKYKMLKDCYYRFYLEQIAGLEEEWIEFEKKLSARVLGIMVHEIFEEIINELKPGANNGLKVNTEVIKQVIHSKMDKYKLKIPGYYFTFYEKIIVPRLQHSLQTFFGRLQKKTENSIDSMCTEWTPESYHEFIVHDRTSFYLSGRIDLLINSGEKYHLIDFKTGGSDYKQLDFYHLLLEPGLKEGAVIRKYFYTVMDEKLTRSFNDYLKLKTNLKDELQEFINSEKYSASYKSSCKKCSYRDICRVVIK